MSGTFIFVSDNIWKTILLFAAMYRTLRFYVPNCDLEKNKRTKSIVNLREKLRETDTS